MCNETMYWCKNLGFHKKNIILQDQLNNLKSMSKITKFGLIGVSGFLIDFSITYLLKEAVGINFYLANAFGFAIASSSNYLLNKKWTFGDYGNIKTNQYLSFLAVSSIGLFFNSLLIMFFTQSLSLNFYLGKVLAIIVVFFWNFTINKLFVFGRKSPEDLSFKSID